MYLGRVYERKDAFYKRAKREGYRARSAYKLLELQRTFHLLQPGDRVVDLGSWPGGWVQVAAAVVGATGKVVGIDLVPLAPLPLRFEGLVDGRNTAVTEPELRRWLEPARQAYAGRDARLVLAASLRDDAPTWLASCL